MEKKRGTDRREDVRRQQKKDSNPDQRKVDERRSKKDRRDT